MKPNRRNFFRSMAIAPVAISDKTLIKYPLPIMPRETAPAAGIIKNCVFVDTTAADAIMRKIVQTLRSTTRLKL